MTVFKSPLEDWFHLPSFLDPLLHLVYLPTTYVAKVLDFPPGKCLRLPQHLDRPADVPG